MIFVEYDDEAAWAAGAARAIASDLVDVLADAQTGERSGGAPGNGAGGGRAVLAVPGGTTPGPVFDRLAEATLDWARVTVIPTDERQVEETSPRSNARLIRERLMTGQAGAASFQPLFADGRIDAGAADVLPPDVAVLGMGDDWHIASLFPGAAGLATALAPAAPPLLALAQPGSGEARVTLSAPALVAARRVHLLLRGDGKRLALEDAPRDDIPRAPVGLVLARACVHWSK